MRAFTLAIDTLEDQWPADHAWLVEAGALELRREIAGQLALEPCASLSSNPAVVSASEALLAFWRGAMGALG
jgi:hypothetical protein